MNPPFVDSCIVVGAGIAGLAAARTLAAHGVAVTVLDKARGVGGRLATRRIGDAVCDFGAQSFTVRDGIFMRDVEEWIAAGAAQSWPAHGAREHHPSRTADIPSAPGHPPSLSGPGSGAGAASARIIGAAGMTSIPKYLARGLDIRLGMRVVEVNEWSGGWEVATEDGTLLHAASVLLTPPLPQVCDLLRASRIRLDEDTAAVLRAVRYEPCLAVMARLAAPSAVPAPGYIAPDAAPAEIALGSLVMNGGPVGWIADNQRKGISPGAPSVTIQSTAAYARAHFDDDTDRVAGALLDAARPWLGGAVVESQVHRWRYSLPVNNVGARWYIVPEVAPLVLAGDAFGAARVEGAWQSGRSAAEALLDPASHLPRRPGYAFPLA